MVRAGGWLDLEYAIDARDRICRVSERWDAVAREAGAPQLEAARVLGTSLWGHVTDPTTRLLWEALVGAVRTSGRPRSVPLRCDTPEWRRWILMEVVAGDAEVVFHTRLERLEGRASVPLLETGALAPPTYRIRMCSWCKRVAAPDGEWLEVEEAIARLGLFETDLRVEITHGICEPCEARVVALL
jgi:hypothetical protein